MRFKAKKETNASSFAFPFSVSLKLPELSAWVFERPNLSGDFVTSPGASEPGVALGTLPLGVQEMAIVQDLLMVMTVS